MNTDCWYYYIGATEDEPETCIKGLNIDWCDEHCPIYKNMKAHFENSNLPEKFWNPFSLKSVPKDKAEIGKIIDIRNNLEDFVSSGKNLLLQSEKCGNGKTSWGIKLLQKQIELNSKGSSSTIPPAYFVYVPDLLLQARQSISNKNSNWDKIQYITQNCPLVHFDDIACLPLKDYDLLILSTIIESRILKGLSSIFTTNLQGDTLKANLGERLYDRIVRLSTVVTLKSDSLRGRDE